MTRDELTAGLVRLLAVACVVLAAVVAAGALSAAVLGHSLSAGIADALGLLGAGLLVGGVVAFLATAPVERRGGLFGADTRLAVVDAEVRRGRERAAIGLFASGIAAIAIAVVLG